MSPKLPVGTENETVRGASDIVKYVRGSESNCEQDSRTFVTVNKRQLTFESEVRGGVRGGLALALEDAKVRPPVVHDLCGVEYTKV
jgi:hypothetical protein